MPERLQKAYKTIMDDHFTTGMTISFHGERWDDKAKAMVEVKDPIQLVYEKVTWKVANKAGEVEEKGLRYGENPGQEAALYKLVNGNLALGEVETIQPGRYLASDAELLQSGKHPGKTNITDADNALSILRYFMDEPVASIMKHNNPCGVSFGTGGIAAIGCSLLEAYLKANMADRVAAFGGTIALNRPVDRITAEAIVANYSEVVVAPEFEQGVMDIFAKKKNLRVMRIANMARLKEYIGTRVLDFKSLMDGGIIAQLSYAPKSPTLADIKALSLGYSDMRKVSKETLERLGYPHQEGRYHEVKRKPTEKEYRYMWFGWLVESGITSNSVIYVKDGVTVGIGTGEQDRVGVAEIARDKAYTKLKDRLCFERLGISYNEAELKVKKVEGDEWQELASKLHDIRTEVKDTHGGLEGAVAVSDAFFPFRDGVDVCLGEGVKAIIQPGGSIADYESIEACNEKDATMVFTGQRSFKH